ncbi:hypothetical protein HNR23_001602 [Nocardiopsis mwathae]|uniref:Uncharacterized protein n=1 Tax=Nocardiopsis mwathae TaxID=1472723 RepID=A0A7X0D4Q0_9ACTN|nr:hypothetical protein [Nocardiopsis mwathae]MBB6171542.1 hypothetical protein [Nocardiopsis mwathae]
MSASATWVTRSGITTLTRGRVRITYDRYAAESRCWSVYFDGRPAAERVGMDSAHWALLINGVPTMIEAVDLLNAAKGDQNARRRLKSQSADRRR